MGSTSDQVVALGNVPRPASGLAVRSRSVEEVAVKLVQVAADGMPAVPLAENLSQTVCLSQPGGGAEDVADRDRTAEHRGVVLLHRVVGESDEVVVPGEDLWPVGLLGTLRVVVKCSRPRAISPVPRTCAAGPQANG